ncbi:unannotated protein [freshwater metagenome]|uniref:Unannotated protein n=1 Tax=freshwater metagenome TaxID=449393 RepID=A0A6J7DDP3_9ZZZZ
MKAAATEAVSGSPKLVLDLTETTFVDSTALGVIIGLVKRVRPVGGDVVLVNVDPEIARTLAITGLDELLNVFEHRDPAVAALIDG